MSEYVPKPFPKWMFHEVLPDRVAENEVEAERLERQGYTRQRVKDIAALEARLKYHRAEVALIEAQLEALGKPQTAPEPTPMPGAAPAPEARPGPSFAAPAPAPKRRGGWPKGKRRSKEK